MSGLQWYPRYVGDYARKTQQLSMLEHGAYTLLLDYYYATGKPLLFSNARSNATSNSELMPDHSRLYRLCSAITKLEQDAVDNVISMFFELTDQGYINTKAEETIVKQQAAHQKRVNAGRKGGKQKSSNATSNALAKPKQPEPEPEPYKKYNKKDFDSFFEAYPKQTEPYEAKEAFIQQIEEGEDPQQIIEAAKQYASEQEGNEKKYIKSPVTFLDKKIFHSPEYCKRLPKPPVDMSKYPEWMQDLAKRIGTAYVVSWFLDAKKDGNVLIVKRKFSKDWIKTHYWKDVETLGIKEIKYIPEKNS